MRHFTAARVLLAIGWSIAAAAAEPGGPASADALATRAAAAAGRGDLREAADLWRQAANAEEAEPEQRFRALLRLGELERDVGRTQAGIEALVQSLAVARAGLGPAREAAARAALASALRESGEFAGATRELDAAAALAAQGGAPELAPAIENERGNLYAARGDVVAARQAFGRAAAAAAAGDASLAFRARANAVFLAAADVAVEALRAELAEARAVGRPLPATHEHAQSWLLLGRAGARAAARDAGARALLARDAQADLDRALAIARELGDAAAASWALGSQAELRRAQGLGPEALRLAREALREARRARQPDAELEWLALLARVERERGQRTAALAYFEQAAGLAAERRSSRRVGSALPRTGVSDGEVYLGLVDLLLQRAREQGDPAAAAQDLLAAQRTMERLKATELRDYFRDDCVDAYREKVRDPASASPRAAVIYPIVLPDRLEILVSSQRGIRQFSVSVSGEELDATVDEFGRLVRKVITHQYLGPAQRLHQLLVAPLLPHLEELGADTLVFVAGGALRTVPMAALHDGTRFLIERFAIANTPGLELTDPRPIDAEAASVILGGLGESVAGFPALEYVPDELTSVREIMGGRILLDAEFTRAGLIDNLERREWGIVHIATHGAFGASPEETFLLTHDGRLGLDELAEAVGAFRYRETPLDLILLSACETAAGDQRAALGLAGIAVKAGARSAVGTLWAVNDEATAVLVKSFYRALREPGTSRAAALQQAQRTLLGDRRYRHPRYWSPFLLISNWL